MTEKTATASASLTTFLSALDFRTRYYNGPESDHFDGRQFFLANARLGKGFFAFLKWRLTADRSYWPPYQDLDQVDKPPGRVMDEGLRVSYVGHVTSLVQTGGCNILFDPVWADRASPLSWAGPRRVHPPGIALADLPPIDVVLISHNHYDHLDLPTLAQIWQRDRPRIIAPLGNDVIIHAYGPTIRVDTVDWGESVKIGDKVEVHAGPMHHWSARSLFDQNRALWAAFTVTSPTGNVHFIGDSGYGDGRFFREARRRFGSFRLAFLPIGSYDPQWFMHYGHMNPEEAFQAWQDLGKPYMVPYHYGVFPLADTGYGEPLPRLRKAMEQDASAHERIRPLRPGQHWAVPLPTS